MWPTIARARRRLIGELLPGEPVENEEPPPPTPRLEDVVLIFGAAEMFQLGEALESVFGDTIERPDTPARSNAPWRCCWRHAAPRATPTVLRRPAVLTTPESWEIHIDGTDRATSRALRAAGRTGFFDS